MILTIIVHWIKRPIGWIAITLTIMVVSPYLWGIKTGIGPIDIILEMFWGEKTNTAFPLFPWLVYPLFGMVLNSLISSMRDRDAFLKYSTLQSSFTNTEKQNTIKEPRDQRSKRRMNGYFHFPYGTGYKNEGCCLSSFLPWCSSTVSLSFDPILSVF